ncbi:MAG: dinitrogenase iron-molybdenum cofactor biosynthesis domain-containing protein [Desulfobacula sp.]|nr:dinitrogenase iron-molybdenum cofactor biosynthesis domain-containing protein [Desulfobacula sp.]
MNIAITIWGNRISPVFDSANTLMIVQVENFKIISRRFEDFNPKITTRIASNLKNFHMDVLICGAITDAQSEIIEKSGINLISFITGDADKVLVSFLKKPSRISDFLMPGGNIDTHLANSIIFNDMQK